MGMSSVKKSDTGFSSEDEDPWDVDTTTEEEENEIEDEGLLTMLVRKSYLKHLERTLKKNYEESVVKEQIRPQELSEVISFHAKFLEKRALRSSMRVGIYQRYMVKVIDDIKQATKKSIMHSTFTRRKRKKRVRVEKGTQTDEVAKPVGISKPGDKTDMRNMLSSAFGFSPGEHEGIDSYEELLNILTSSPNLAKDSTIDHSVSLDSTVANGICESPKRRMNLDERLQLMGFIGKNDDDRPPASQPPSIPDALNCQNSFEEPPCKMSKVELPTDWKREVVVQEEVLAVVLQRKSPFMRAIIERRFRDLFGIDDVPFLPAQVPVLAPPTVPVADAIDPHDELLLARRQVAGHVVKALTPYFVQGRIGSRLVFKTLAKRITDRLLSKTMTPDPKDVKKEVKICFALQSEILSTKDVDKVFTSLGY